VSEEALEEIGFELAPKELVMMFGGCTVDVADEDDAMPVDQVPVGLGPMERCSKSGSVVLLTHGSGGGKKTVTGDV
jgi:hypothetical protein